jgi:HEAT repeat protein
MGDAALPEIQKHLRDQRWFFVRNLVWIIGEIGEPRFARYLGLIADHVDLRVRKEVVKALAKLGGSRAAEIMVRALSDPDIEIQMIASRGLGRSGVSPPIPELHSVVRRHNMSGRQTGLIQAAAIALGQLGDVDALPHLRRVARPPFLFRSRRMAATEAAQWAVSAILGENVGAAPQVDLSISTEGPPISAGAPGVGETELGDAGKREG